MGIAKVKLSGEMDNTQKVVFKVEKSGN